MGAPRGDEVRERASRADQGKNSEDQIPGGKGAAQFEAAVAALVEQIGNVKDDEEIRAHRKDRDLRVRASEFDPRLSLMCQCSCLTRGRAPCNRLHHCVRARFRFRQTLTPNAPRRGTGHWADVSQRTSACGE